MKIDFKNPIISSLIGMGVTFLVSIIVLCVTNPSYIMEISKHGKKTKNVYLLVTYSLLFSVVIGIVVLLCNKRFKSNSPRLRFVTKSFNPAAYSPRI